LNYLVNFSISWLCDSASHMQDICSGVKLLVLLLRERPLMFPMLVFTLAELQVESSCEYWGLPFDVGVRFWGWWVSPRPDIDDVLLYCAVALRCTTPIWLLQSLFGDDSWSELSDILGWWLRASHEPRCRTENKIPCSFADPSVKNFWRCKLPSRFLFKISSTITWFTNRIVIVAKS